MIGDSQILVEDKIQGMKFDQKNSSNKGYIVDSHEVAEGVSGSKRDRDNSLLVVSIFGSDMDLGFIYSNIVL